MAASPLIIDGLRLCPDYVPWEIVADDSIEHPDIFYECIDIANSWVESNIIIYGEIDDDRFNDLYFSDVEERPGIVLHWIGALPDPDFDEPGPGGITDLTWNEEGGIWVADIIIDSEDSYDRQTYRDRLLHEFGHIFGLAHAQDSLDLGSCMSSPPQWNCDMTIWEKELILECIGL